MDTQDLELCKRLMRVAPGEEPADLLLQGGTVVNVYTGEGLEWDVAIAGHRIAAVGGTCQ